MSNVSDSLRKGIAINFVAKYLNLIIQILITSILARILTASEYGVIAVITVFITFFGMLGDMGVSPAIIQNKDLDGRDTSNIFIFSIIIAVILSFAFYGFSYFIAYYYNNDIYIKLGHYLCISIFFNTLNIVPNAILLKAKKFKVIGFNSMIVNIIVGMITISLAYNKFSYYSLVINSILQSICMFSINFYLSKLKVNFEYNSESIKKIKSYSLYQFLFNFINYFSRNLDNLLIGKFIGSSALGYYDNAYKLMLYPVQNLTNVITPVLHPILSEYQNDKDIIYNHYIKVVKVLSLLGAFLSVFCFFSANDIIIVMFGNKWADSAGIFKILSISIIIQMTISTTGSIFQSVGETKLLFKVGMINTFITISGIVIGLLYKSVEYIAFGVVIGYFLNAIVSFYSVINKALDKSIIVFWKEFKSLIFILILMISGNIVLQFNVNGNLNSLIVKFAITMIFYLIGLLLTKEYTVFIKLIRK